jgi:hypothetical protein
MRRRIKQHSMLYPCKKEEELVDLVLRLQLGQARGGDANYTPQRRTVKQILCAAHVINTSAKSMHTHFHTVLHVLIRVNLFMFFTFLFCIYYRILFLFIVVVYTPWWGQ